MSIRSRRSVLWMLPLLLASGCGGGDAAPEAGSVSTEEAEATTSPAGDGSEDLATLEAYELTMEKVDRYYAAYGAVGRALAGMTAEERERAEGSMDASDASLDEYAARIEAHPVYREAIEGAGLSSREFAVMTMAMLQAGMAQAVIQMRPDADADSLAREMQANPENVRFMREHAVELEAKQQALEQEFERLGISED